MSSETKKSILIIDDSEFDCNLLKGYLEKKNFNVTTIQDGTKWSETIKEGNFDLIILDILMPKISGLEVLKLIRKEFNPIKLPVIMLSAMSEDSDVVELLELGANDYIIKPANFKVLQSRVNTHLRIAELNKDSLRKRELEAVQAMIVTYNHEINNPLATAVGVLDRIDGKVDKSTVDLLERSLFRIRDIVRKIEGVTIEKELPIDDYVDEVKMIKLK